MSQEIERKFLLLCSDFKSQACGQERIMQGYLCSNPQRTVRIRIKGDKGYITIKGEGDSSGVSRFEWEKELSLQDAESLLLLCEPGLIDKTRFLVKDTDGVHTWEVDEFYGENEGLVIAELELGSVDEHFDKPSWLGEEVTGDGRYYNSYLAKNPYKNWNKSL